MPVHVNFSDVQDYEPLPEDTYDVVVTGVTEKQGPSAPYLWWELTVVGGQFDGRKLFHMTSLSKAALFGLKRTLIAFGVSSEAVRAGYDFEPTDFINVKCAAKTTIEEYNGQMRNKTVLVRSAETKPIDEAPKATTGRKRKKA
jgi:hypothetical protein